MIEASGVRSSWLALAMKSERSCSARRWLGAVLDLHDAQRLRPEGVARRQEPDPRLEEPLLALVGGEAHPPLLAVGERRRHRLDEGRRADQVREVRPRLEPRQRAPAPPGWRSSPGRCARRRGAASAASRSAPARSPRASAAALAAPAAAPALRRRRRRASAAATSQAERARPAPKASERRQRQRRDERRQPADRHGQPEREPLRHRRRALPSALRRLSGTAGPDGTPRRNDCLSAVRHISIVLQACDEVGRE